MQVKLIHHTPLDACTEAAGVCRNSKDPEKALVHALAAGHLSLAEHWSATFKITGVSRILSHQLVRHRIGFSYAQRSQRSVKEGEGYDWYVAPPTAVPFFHTAMEYSRQNYERLLEMGMPLEDARYALPQGCTTELVFTGNARALLHFFNLRLCTWAQWELRAMAQEICKQCQKLAPLLFQGPFTSCDTCNEKCK